MEAASQTNPPSVQANENLCSSKIKTLFQPSQTPKLSSLTEPFIPWPLLSRGLQSRTCTSVGRSFCGVCFRQGQGSTSLQASTHVSEKSASSTDWTGRYPLCGCLLKYCFDRNLFFRVVAKSLMFSLDVVCRKTETLISEGWGHSKESSPPSLALN